MITCQDTLKKHKCFRNGNQNSENKTGRLTKTFTVNKSVNHYWFIDFIA